ncbi:PREDICTED: G-type lectin S-receptor-like serine/threonine-protein kinase At4g27290 [Nelumbo nucifera]|uniref:Receptor-like serine/threonine-protein kinase n=1 Tax=Nelumbo nucifera TaxID=4432 RepID=A0A1U7Z1L5_NELNU|nr:PREDICTED: G-type lectin S-receptor-like serine/threonine-protein kinase At4g27290 [Nelumbo nucifera]
MEVPWLFVVCCTVILLLFSWISIATDTISLTQSIGDGETLVSSGQRFELGFFSPGSSKNRYLGIWYKNIPLPLTVVWVANRNSPIPDTSGVLKIDENGNLVLVNKTSSLIWSSNSSIVAKKSSVAQLLDSGNLVLREGDSESYMWQSFDFPSDTLLPGMKVGWTFKTNLNRYLTSWKSTDDPAVGDFSYRIIDNIGLPQLVLREGSIKMFRTGTWNGLRFSGVFRNSSAIFRPIFVSNADELYYTYESNDDSNSIITRFVLNQSGALQRYVWNRQRQKWVLMFDLLKDMCNAYNQCGANGICRPDHFPICKCLNGFTPKSPKDWVMLDWSGGCTRPRPSDCKNGRDFVKLQGVKLPDLMKFWVNNSMSLEECKQQCLHNCSCVAYANPFVNRSGSGCIIWFGDLIDVREFKDGNVEQDLYIWTAMVSPEIDQTGAASNETNRRVLVIVVISITSSMLLLGWISWFMIRNKRRKTKDQQISKKEELDLPLFDWVTVVSSANNFSYANKIGQGGFGPVYKGVLPTGQEVAMKRLSTNSGQGLEEFKNEVALIAKLQHRNLVKLLGCCIQGDERILLYEYMANKSLDYFIFDHDRRAPLMIWQKRFNIIIGIARGLLYLHQDSRLRIIHRDLKASNILLDNEMNAKISDFGIARIIKGDQIEAKTKRVIGTYGYMSPEYAIDGHFSFKSDVFSFGVLLLEIVTGKKNRGFHHPYHHHNLLGHAWIAWKEGKGLELVDANIMESCVVSEVSRCIQVGLLCVQQIPEDRPDMASVLFMLINNGSSCAALPQPKQPGFFIERSSIGCGFLLVNKDCQTENVATITSLEAR